MSETADTAAADSSAAVDRDRCTYPGCTRARRADPATGRPSGYCEQADPGGPVHNRATAWKARRAQRAAAAAGGEGAGEQPSPAGAVSMARLSLEQRLAELPGVIDGVRRHLDAVVAAVGQAGDLEAAGAEVDDAHRAALAAVAEAEGRAAAAERAARHAHTRAVEAERDREEADAVTQDALAETARIRALADEQIAAARTEAAAAVTAAANDRQAVVALGADLDAARRDAAAAGAVAAELRVELATATATADAATRAAGADRDALAAVRAELDTTRAEARAEREALRTDHATQLAQLQRNADERAYALTEALNAARDSAAVYRTQLATHTDTPAPRRPSPTTDPADE